MNTYIQKSTYKGVTNTHHWKNKYVRIRNKHTTEDGRKVYVTEHPLMMGNTRQTVKVPAGSKILKIVNDRKGRSIAVAYSMSKELVETTVWIYDNDEYIPALDSKRHVGSFVEQGYQYHVFQDAPHG